MNDQTQFEPYIEPPEYEEVRKVLGTLKLGSMNLLNQYSQGLRHDKVLIDLAYLKPLADQLLKYTIKDADEWNSKEWTPNAK